MAVIHLSLSVEDAHSYKKDISLCNLDFKGAFPSTYHKQLVRTLVLLGLPNIFTRPVFNLYRGASTDFGTPHGHTPPLVVRRGFLQGDPMPSLLFDLMFEPLTSWLTAADKGYTITSCVYNLSMKWYADDGTLVTNSVEDMISLLDLVRKCSSWSGIQSNVDKCKNTAYYIYALQTIPRNKHRDDALRARLAHVTRSDHTIGSLTQNEPFPGRYMDTSLTASLSPEAHLY
jgi:hypothetical protein